MTWKEEVEPLQVLHFVRQSVGLGNDEIGRLSILCTYLFCHKDPISLLCSSHTINLVLGNLLDRKSCILYRVKMNKQE